LEEKKIEELTALTQKIRQFAQNDLMRNRIDTLAVAKQIQDDIDAGSYDTLMTHIDTAITENNTYKASYIIEKLDGSVIDDGTKAKLDVLKEKMRSKDTQLRLQKAKNLNREKILRLEMEAKEFATLKKYDEAIKRYMEIYKMAPENSEYNEKIQELQQKKFEYEKFKKEVDAKFEMNALILRAEDSYAKEMAQDALDYYIRAYKILPGTEKTIAGVVKVLAACEPRDARFITPQLVGRVLSKFIKDFLTYVDSNYYKSKDEIGLAILTKVTFIKENKSYEDMILKFKDFLYNKNLGLGDDQFKLAAFAEAMAFYKKALLLKDTSAIKNLIAVCIECIKLSDLMKLNKKKEASQFFALLAPSSNKTGILSGALYLSNKLLDEKKYDDAKYLYKKVDGYSISSLIPRITELKGKRRELKRKKRLRKKVDAPTP
ncbi:MAG: hypothetical protein GY765_25870, partial [bacterium]|nr:hypothetical protein [bacterium]